MKAFRKFCRLRIHSSTKEINLLIYSIFLFVFQIKNQLTFKDATKKCKSNSSTRVDPKKGKDDPNAPAHAFCVNKELNILYETGDVSKEELKKFLDGFIDDKDKLSISLEKCAEKKDTPEETAYHLYGCVLKIANGHT